MHELTVLADYHQVCVVDDAAVADFGDAWSEPAVRLGLAVQPGGFAFATWRNVTVPVAVSVLEHEPVIDLPAWDRVVRGSIDVAGDALVIYGPSDRRADAPRVSIASGTHRFAVCSAGRATVSVDGLDGSDHYFVAVWPGAPTPVAQITRG